MRIFFSSSSYTRSFHSFQVCRLPMVAIIFSFEEWIAMTREIRISDGNNANRKVRTKKNTNMLIKANFRKRMAGIIERLLKIGCLFPFEYFNRDGIDHYSPNGEDANLLSTIRQMCAFERNISQCIIQLLKRKDFAKFLKPSRECICGKKCAAQKKLRHADQIGKWWNGAFIPGYTADDKSKPHENKQPHETQDNHFEKSFDTMDQGEMKDIMANHD